MKIKRISGNTYCKYSEKKGGKEGRMIGGGEWHQPK
jgi:hypothetical protein